MRLYCDHCGYPQKTCICSDINAVSTSLEIVIIQHEKEASHAKNTARLITLCIPTTRIVLANDSIAMQSLSEQCLLKRTALIYPSEESTPIEKAAPTVLSQIDTLIFLDGSWKQAFGLVKQNPWLTELQNFHFTSAPPSNYSIRHTTLNKALSTLEATAYAIQCIEETDVSGLHNAQRALQNLWQGPTSHRRQL